MHLSKSKPKENTHDSAHQPPTGSLSELKMGRTGRPLKVLAFNANGDGRQHFELSKQLQDHRIGVTLLWATHIKLHERFCIQNYSVYRTDRLPGLKGGTAFATRKGIPYNRTDLPPPVSIEATRL